MTLTTNICFLGIVSKIWKEDSFFGSQYLNGINPTLIKKCFKIPGNFSVDEQMVASSLGTSTSLETELQVRAFSGLDIMVRANGIKQA